MRLSRTNMPLASSDSVISQLTYAVFLDNLAPHLRAENPDHKLFCHSQPQNPPQLSKSGLIGDRTTRQFFTAPPDPAVSFPYGSLRVRRSRAHHMPGRGPQSPLPPAFSKNSRGLRGGAPE